MFSVTVRMSNSRPQEAVICSSVHQFVHCPMLYTLIVGLGGTSISK